MKNVVNYHQNYKSNLNKKKGGGQIAASIKLGLMNYKNNNKGKTKGNGFYSSQNLEYIYFNII